MPYLNASTAAPLACVQLPPPLLPLLLLPRAPLLCAACADGLVAVAHGALQLAAGLLLLRLLLLGAAAMRHMKRRNMALSRGCRQLWGTCRTTRRYVHNKVDSVAVQGGQ